MSEKDALHEDKAIKVDGKEVSEEELKEKLSQKDTRLFQESPTAFRTLHRLTE